MLLLNNDNFFISWPYLQMFINDAPVEIMYVCILIVYTTI
jgi:hypothetical protein